MASTLILGGARSGKSSYAESLAKGSGLEVHYVATAQPLDHEMVVRIHHHQQQRPDDWLLIEEPLELLDVVQCEADQSRLLLIDCLTLWLNNLIGRGDSDEEIRQQISELAYMAAVARGKVVMVSNEVGLGIVGENPLVRRFVDQSGWMNQQIASTAQNVVLVTAGLPLALKGALE